MDSFGRLREQSNEIGSEFLMTELDTAFTFLAVAETTASAESRDRNRRNALEAYNTVVRMRPKVVVEARFKSDFQKKLKDLKKRLQEVGFEIR